jgi:hypothetical protein
MAGAGTAAAATDTQYGDATVRRCASPPVKNMQPTPPRAAGEVCPEQPPTHASVPRHPRHLGCAGTGTLLAARSSPQQRAASRHRILALSQGVGFRSTYTEIQGGTQTTPPPP